MNKQLKPKDIETLEVIKAYIEENKIPPSLGELAELLNLATKSTVRSRLNHLRACGEVDFKGNTARSIILSKYDYKLIPKAMEDSQTD